MQAIVAALRLRVNLGFPREVAAAWARASFLTGYVAPSSSEGGTHANPTTSRCGSRHSVASPSAPGIPMIRFDQVCTSFNSPQRGLFGAARDQQPQQQQHQHQHHPQGNNSTQEQVQNPAGSNGMGRILDSLESGSLAADHEQLYPEEGPLQSDFAALDDLDDFDEDWDDGDDEALEDVVLDDVFSEQPLRG